MTIIKVSFVSGEEIMNDKTGGVRDHQDTDESDPLVPTMA